MTDNTTDNAKTQNRSAGFYEAKGMARYTLIIGKEHKDKLDSFASKFGISQGNVVEVLLDQANQEVLAPFFNTKAGMGGRGRKASKTATQRDLIKMLKGMTPEQLEAAQKSIQAVKAPEPATVV